MANQKRDHNADTIVRHPIGILPQILESSFRCLTPPMLWGPPGIGKSDSVRETVQKMGGHLVDIRLTTIENTDIKGIPYYSSKKDSVDISRPFYIPTDEEVKKHKFIVLFFDEINCAAPSVQAAAYSLILDRKIDNFHLADNVYVVGAGNMETDRSATYTMPTALMNRFVHIHLKHDFNSWETWALDNKIHPDILGYLSRNKDELFNFNPRSGQHAFATPRSWTFVSRFIYDFENNVKGADDEILNSIIAGSVGEGIASKFTSIRNCLKDMPLPADILSGKVKGNTKPTKSKASTKTSMQVGAQFMLTANLCHELNIMYGELGKNKTKTNSKWGDFLNAYDNILFYMMNNMNKEMVVLGTHYINEKYKITSVDPKSLKAWATFFSQYQDLIMNLNE